jgi:hypothetical protein
MDGNTIVMKMVIMITMIVMMKKMMVVVVMALSKSPRFDLNRCHFVINQPGNDLCVVGGVMVPVRLDDDVITEEIRDRRASRAHKAFFA